MTIRPGAALTALLFLLAPVAIAEDAALQVGSGLDIAFGAPVNIRVQKDETNLGDPGNYAHLVEFGTKAHGPKHAKFMTLPGGGFARRVRGTQPRPFMRPAFDSQADAANKKIEEVLWKGIVREAKRMMS